jgi:SAM-dependent methyltransferase
VLEDVPARNHVVEVGTPHDPIACELGIYPVLLSPPVRECARLIGTLGLTAAENGYKVSGYEPNDETRTFANWRAKKYGLDAEFAGDGIVWRSNFYDVVSCWHVFEHIKDPTIALERIRHILKPGGLLISESGFEDTATPMHHSHPDWEGELRRYGFVKTAEEFTYQLMPVSEMVPA